MPPRIQLTIKGSTITSGLRLIFRTPDLGQASGLLGPIGGDAALDDDDDSVFFIKGNPIRLILSNVVDEVNGFMFGLSSELSNVLVISVMIIEVFGESRGDSSDFRFGWPMWPKPVLNTFKSKADVSGFLGWIKK